jgi:hypothetical protein
MDSRTAKQDATNAGLELYYDPQWKSWGLIDPNMNVEGIWLSPGELRTVTRQQFGLRYIAVMQNRINPDMGGEFPVSA